VTGQTERVEHIPVLWIEPDANAHPRRLALFLPHFTGSKEKIVPQLEELAADGFVAMSFDPWQHGERGTGESPHEMVERVFAAYRRRMWPILGQTTLDVLRVIDWAVDTLAVESSIRVGGLSMGGDIAVAAAGIDRRIQRVAAVVATPDWLRPGMHDLFEPERLVDQGEPDSYARWFYDELNPLTHVGRYAHGLEMRFWCGEEDTTVPADGALRFEAELEEAFPGHEGRVEVEMLPGSSHMDVRDSARWWPACREWLAGP
jgi:dienelactone hydrolase